MKSLKWFLVGVCLAAVFMIPPVLAVPLEVVLKDSEPIDRGTCKVTHPKFGEIILECVKGKRHTDGAILYAILFDGEIIAVFEQAKKEEAPKQIWGKQWQET